MLLDAASLYFRAFYGVPTSVTAPDGRPVNAVRGFLDMTARLLTAHSPTRLVACWDDDWRPAFRVDALPSYKAHRLSPEGGEETPDELGPQVPVLVDVLAAAGIARVGAPGYEADDVIGTLATRARGPVDVVTGDRDLFQLVDDARGVRVLYTNRGIADIEVVDEAAVSAKYGIPGGPTPTSRCCVGTPATACRAWPASARRRRRRWSRSSATWPASARPRPGRWCPRRR